MGGKAIEAVDRPTSTSPGRVAYAVTHEEPPRVLIAEDEVVLSRALATQVIAQESADRFAPEALEAIRSALLEERWGDAVSTWMSISRSNVDVYPDEQVLTNARLDAVSASISIRMSPIFKDPAGP